MATKNWTVGQVTFTGDDAYWDLMMERTLPTFLPSVAVPIGVHTLFPPDYYYDNDDALILSPVFQPILYFVYLTRLERRWVTVIVEFSEKGMNYRLVDLPLDFRFTVDPEATRVHETLDDYKSDWVAAAVSYLIPRPTPVFFVFVLIRFYEEPPEFMKNKFVLSVQLIPLDDALPTRRYIVTGLLSSLFDFPMWCWYPIVPCPNGVIFPLSTLYQVSGDEIYTQTLQVDPNPDFYFSFLQWDNTLSKGKLTLWGFSNQYLPYVFGSASVAGGTKPSPYPIIPSRTISPFRRFNYDDLSIDTISSTFPTPLLDVDRFSFGVYDPPYAIYGNVRSIYSSRDSNVRWGPDNLFPYYVKTGSPYFVSQLGGFMNVTDINTREQLLPLTVHQYISEGYINRLLFPSTSYSILRFPPLWGWLSDDLLLLSFGKGLGPILPFSPFPHTDNQNHISPLTLPATSNSPFYLPLQPLVPLRPYEALMWMHRTFTVKVGHPTFIPHGDVYIPVVVLSSPPLEEGRIGIFRFKRFGNVPYKVRDVTVNVGEGGKIELVFTPPPTGQNKVCYFIVEQILQPENPMFFSNTLSVLSHSLFHFRDWEVDYEGNGNWKPFSGVMKKLSPNHPPKKIKVKLSVPSLSQYIRILSVLRRES